VLRLALALFIKPSSARRRSRKALIDRNGRSSSTCSERAAVGLGAMATTSASKEDRIYSSSAIRTNVRTYFILETVLGTPGGFKGWRKDLFELEVAVEGLDRVSSILQSFEMNMFE
jgi:hypothetical protein